MRRYTCKRNEHIYVSKLILEFILSKLEKDYLINQRDISKLYYIFLFYGYNYLPSVKDQTNP